MGVFNLGKMTFTSLFKEPETTRYPAQKKTPPEGLKGHISNDVDTCILCGICSKRCPADAIAVDKAARTWTIDPFLCVQCGSCVRECPKHCLSMEPSYTPPATEKSVKVFDVPEHPKPERPKRENDVKVG